MRKVLLYRPFEADNLERELAAAETAGFTLVDDRDFLLPGDLVIPRFYPFWNYLEDELKVVGVKTIAPYSQHDWLSDIRVWAPVLGSLTPQTWLTLTQVKDSGFSGPFFVKGIDKSLKQDFERFCFAEDIQDLPRVLGNLKGALFAEQELVIREFKELKNYGRSAVSGAPIAHEFRVFVYGSQIISSGFYWESVKTRASIAGFAGEPPRELIEKVIELVGDNANFYSVDVALTQDGEWLVVEVNDGFLSGLTAIDPLEHYSKLYSAI